MRSQFLVLAAVLLIGFSSCRESRKGKCTFQAVLETQTGDPAALNSTVEVLKKRLDQFGFVQQDISMHVKGNTIAVELTHCRQEDIPALRHLCIFTGGLEIYETYDNKDVYPYLAQVNPLFKEKKEQEPAAKGPIDTASLSLTEQVQLTHADSLQIGRSENPLFARLNPAVSKTRDGQYDLQPGPVVGYCLVSDTAQVMAMLHDDRVQHIFPADLRFMWSANSQEGSESVFMLIALKTGRDGGAYLSGDIIKDVRLNYSREDQASPQITLEMYAEAARGWARMTRNNIGRSIAMVLDGKVYSYPTVQGEILGGATTITGRFTKEEAEELANVCKNGGIPTPLRIATESLNCK